MFNTHSPLVKKKTKQSSGRHDKFDKKLKHHLERSKFVANIPNLIGNDAHSKQNSLSFNKESGYTIFEKNHDGMKWPIPSPSFAATQGKKQKNLTL